MRTIPDFDILRCSYETYKPFQTASNLTVTENLFQYTLVLFTGIVNKIFNESKMYQRSLF